MYKKLSVLLRTIILSIRLLPLYSLFDFQIYKFSYEISNIHDKELHKLPNLKIIEFKNYSDVIGSLSLHVYYLNKQCIFNLEEEHKQINYSNLMLSNYTKTSKHSDELVKKDHIFQKLSEATNASSGLPNCQDKKLEYIVIENAPPDFNSFLLNKNNYKTEILTITNRKYNITFNADICDYNNHSISFDSLDSLTNLNNCLDDSNSSIDDLDKSNDLSEYQLKFEDNYTVTKYDETEFMNKSFINRITHEKFDTSQIFYEFHKLKNKEGSKMRINLVNLIKCNNIFSS